MTALYQKMKTFVLANPDLLAGYQRDFHVHDRRAIRRMKTGQRWLWVLRTNGTVLFPIGVGQNPIWVTHWFQDGTAGSVRTFLITVTADGCDGTVRAVSREQALALVQEPAPKGMVVWQPDMFGVTVVRDGREIGRIERVNHRIVARLPGVDGSFESWTAAKEAVERHLGPVSPMVCA